jgi:hypothetical protein
MASVTTMSGTRLTTTSTPLTVPIATPMASTSSTTSTDPSGLASTSNTAAITFVSAITEPIERSIPPEITTIACPTAANATGSAAMASALRSKLGRRILVPTRSATKMAIRPTVHASPRAARAIRPRAVARSKRRPSARTTSVTRHRPSWPPVFPAVAV